jgi:peptide/nickel transport system permease protein
VTDAVAAAPAAAVEYEVRRSVPVVLPFLARVVSWPLAFAWIAAGLTWRCLAWGWGLLPGGVRTALVGVVGQVVVAGALAVVVTWFVWGVGRDPSRADVRWAVFWCFLLVVGALALSWVVWRRIGAASGVPAGTDSPGQRLRSFAVEGARYLVFLGDRIPPITGEIRDPDASAGPWHEARRRLRNGRLAMASWIGIVLYLYAGVAAQAGWIATDYHERSEAAASYAPPDGLGGDQPLGRDIFGRNVLDIGLRGITTALWIGVVAALLSAVIGMVLGAVAGYFGRWVDDLIVWLFTTLESIPYLLLLLAFSFIFKKNEDIRDWYNGSFLKESLDVSLGLFTIILAIGLTSWVGICRQVRGEFIRHRDRDYVTAARAIGVPTSRVMFRHIMPNVFYVVLISFSLLFITAIKFEVILSFLGLGLEPREASWGAMISQAKLELLRDPWVWWQLTTATVLMFGLILCVNLFTDALRDALDPRLRQ